MSKVLASPFRVRKNKWDTFSGPAPDSVIKPASWHEWRLKGIGGSDANILMGAVPKEWGTRVELWRIKTKRSRPRPATSAMKRGIVLESRARMVYQEMTGIEMPKAQLIHPEFDFIRTNFDGRNQKARKGLEIKCPGWEDHKEALRGKIPEKYRWQCVHELLVDPTLDVVDYFSFDGKKGVIVPFERDLHLENHLLGEEIEFWEYVETDTLPKEKEIQMPVEKKQEREIIELLSEILSEVKIIRESFGHAPAPSLGKCEDCGSELSLSKFEDRPPYCVPCYVEWKEKSDRSQKWRKR